jgi:phage baseplate assembly protein gpV
VTYDGGGAQTIFADTYYDLTAGGGAGTKTLGGIVNAERDITIDSGVTLDVSNDDYAINVKRYFTNAGTFTMQSGLVTFNGNRNQALTTGGSSFFAITFNTTGGSGKKLTLVDALVMTNNLTITAGTMDLNGQNLNIAGDLSIANNAVWTKGGLVTFNGGATQQLADGNSPPNNLGNIRID